MQHLWPCRQQPKTPSGLNNALYFLVACPLPQIASFVTQSSPRREAEFRGALVLLLFVDRRHSWGWARAGDWLFQEKGVTLRAILERYWGFPNFLREAGQRLIHTWGRKVPANGRT